jgi:TetR/AcrR family transcriptional regulator, transcriptional repressor for nem operon
MGRPRKFDEEVVLSAAMNAFRMHGYAGISVNQLEQATGLSTSSLYNTFEDKAELHRRAVGHYVRMFVLPRLDHYAGPEARLEQLEGLFLSLFEPPMNDGYGCLVINTATEMGSDTDVDVALDAVGRHLGDVLRRELGTDEDALLLLLLYQGVLVAARAGRLNDSYRQAIHHYFSRLRARRDERNAP